MKKVTLLPLIILVLAFLGIADAWYLAQSALSGTPLACDINGLTSLSGCNIVAQSPYSHFFDVPLGVYGVFFYGLVFVAAAIALVTSHKKVHLGLHALGVLGVLASLIFLFIQFVLIKAFCMYCLASAGIALFIFFASFRLWKITDSEDSKKPAVVPWGSDVM
ncbi:MAG: vitamin K epoxide reductase family protein [Minisyncoccia bacterium]